MSILKNPTQIKTSLGVNWCVWRVNIQPQFISNCGEAFQSLVDTWASVWEVSCHMLWAQHWDAYFAYPQSEAGWESQDFPNQMTEKSLSQRGAAMWQICNTRRLLFRVLGWLTLRCREGKGKSVAHSTHSSSKMCGETPRGPNSGTSDMHNNNKTACCNTGGLAAAVEWETDVGRSLFNLSNYSTVWELFLQFGTQIVLVTHCSGT